MSAAPELAHDDAHDDDAVLSRFGYHPQFIRTLRSFESFAVAFSFISITTGIFTTFGFLLNTSGPRGIWTWIIVIVGHLVVPTALMIETNYSPPVALQLAIYLPVTLVLSLILLQPVKGTVVGMQWALRMHGFDERNPEP